MYTVQIDIESSINKRPLLFLSCDTRDLKPITPSHVCISRPLGILGDFGAKM
uniref:Putative LOC101740044 [Bombyx mori] n=1 Tax=Lepeophtheirus salmonis TaxID=72036 RepID=A0A0K2UKF0_LEPSM